MKLLKQSPLFSSLSYRNYSTDLPKTPENLKRTTKADEAIVYS